MSVATQDAFTVEKVNPAAAFSCPLLGMRPRVLQPSRRLRQASWRAPAPYEAAQKSWRRPDGHNQLPKLVLWDKSDCSQCSLKPKCTTATVRKITRDLNEDVRDRVRALADTKAFQQSRREHKKVEMRFAYHARLSRKPSPMSQPGDGFLLRCFRPSGGSPMASRAQPVRAPSEPKAGVLACSSALACPISSDAGRSGGTSGAS